jgi:hypothetical protein
MPMLPPPLPAVYCFRGSRQYVQNQAVVTRGPRRAVVAVQITELPLSRIADPFFLFTALISRGKSILFSEFKSFSSHSRFSGLKKTLACDLVLWLTTTP